MYQLLLYVELHTIKCIFFVNKILIRNITKLMVFMLLTKIKLHQFLLKLVACYLSLSLLIIIPITIRFMDVRTNPASHMCTMISLFLYLIIP